MVTMLTGGGGGGDGGGIEGGGASTVSVARLLHPVASFVVVQRQPQAQAVGKYAYV